jgi:hypothetical protein
MTIEKRLQFGLPRSKTYMKYHFANEQALGPPVHGGLIRGSRGRVARRCHF